MPAASSSISVSGGMKLSAVERIASSSAASPDEANSGKAPSSFDQILLESIREVASQPSDSSNNERSNDATKDSADRPGDTQVRSAVKQTLTARIAGAHQKPETSPLQAPVSAAPLTDPRLTPPVVEGAETTTQDVAPVSDVEDSSTTDSSNPSSVVPVGPEESTSPQAHTTPLASRVANEASFDVPGDGPERLTPIATSPSDAAPNALSPHTSVAADASPTDSVGSPSTVPATPSSAGGLTLAANLERFLDPLATIATSTALPTVLSSGPALGSPADRSEQIPRTTTATSTPEGDLPQLTLSAPQPSTEGLHLVMSSDRMFERLEGVKISAVLANTTSTTLSASPALASSADGPANTPIPSSSGAPAPSANAASEDQNSLASGTEMAAPSGIGLPAFADQTIPDREADAQRDTDLTAPAPGSNASHTESVSPLPASLAAESQGFSQAIPSAVVEAISESAGSGGATSRGPAASDPLPSSAALQQQATAGPPVSRILEAWNGGDNVQTAALQMARLVKNSDSSEMNIALQAETLGNVELKAHIAGDQFGATIAVDRHDVHAALLSDLAFLRQALSEKQLRMDDVKVLQSPWNAAPSEGGRGDRGAQGQPRGTNPERFPASNGSDATSPLESFTQGAGMADAVAIFDSDGRLSVRV